MIDYCSEIKKKKVKLLILIAKCMNFRNIMQEKPGLNEFVSYDFIFTKHWRRRNLLCRTQWLSGVRDAEKTE